MQYENVIGASLEVSKNPTDDRVFLHVYNYPVKNGKYLKDSLVIILSDGPRAQC